MLQAVIVLESGAVDNLKRNAIRHSVEGLRNVHHYGNCYAKGLSLIEVGHYVRSNRDQCRGGVGPWLGCCCCYVAEGGGAKTKNNMSKGKEPISPKTPMLS